MIQERIKGIDIIILWQIGKLLKVLMKWISLQNNICDRKQLNWKCIGQFHNVYNNICEHRSRKTVYSTMNIIWI